jgi:hypothetical protein
MKLALAVTVEPFKFSSRRGGVAYELIYKKSMVIAKTSLPKGII